MEEKWADGWKSWRGAGERNRVKEGVEKET